MGSKTSNQNYYIKHKKQLNEFHKQYYLANRERILVKRKEKYEFKKTNLFD
jgi:hypothetical protein